jgi:hypothetical protein
MLTGTNAVFDTFWTLDAALSAPVLTLPSGPEDTRAIPTDTECTDDR